MNEHRIEGDLVWITLTQGKETCVDLADWPDIVEYRWYARKCRNKFYVAAAVGNAGKQEHFLLHRVLIPSAKMVDHEDGDGLNNRRKNLRPCTNSQNQHNSGKRRHNSSGFKGVVWHQRDRLWYAQIVVGGKKRYLGSFTRSEEAARAYDSAARELHGEFARTNY